MKKKFQIDTETKKEGLNKLRKSSSSKNKKITSETLSAAPVKGRMYWI